MNVKQIYFIALAIFAAVGTWLAQAMGGWDIQTKLLAWMMGVDFITGWLCAAVFHKSLKTETGGYDSRVGLKGLIRKGTIVLIVMIAAQLDQLTNTHAMRTATILFFCANDGMSILENLGIMGIEYPPAMKNMFEVLRKKGDVKKEDKPPDGESE